jgi:hypothetical protein
MIFAKILAQLPWGPSDAVARTGRHEGVQTTGGGSSSLYILKYNNIIYIYVCMYDIYYIILYCITVYYIII